MRRSYFRKPSLLNMMRTVGLSIPLALCLLAPVVGSAQAWVDLMLDGSINLHTVEEEFNAYWQGRPYQKGKGWKQYQRWHWFMDQRTYPSGERIDPAVYMAAAEELRAMRAHGAGDRDDPVWEPLGPSAWNSTSYNPGNGRVNAVAVHPADPNIIYAGTPSGGLWRSTDGASTWQPLFTDLPSMGVSGIVIDTTGSGAILICTGDGDGADTWSAGVLKSIDDGATWQTTGLNWTIGQNRTTRALRMDPTDHDKLLCATSAGLWRTVNGATTWQQIMQGSFRDVEYMPGDTNVVFACSDQLFRSTNGGQNFSGVGITGLPDNSLVGRMAIAVSPAMPDVVYVLCSREEDNSYLGLYRSADGGLTFELRSDSPNLFGYESDGSDQGGQAWYDMALAVDPMNEQTVYLGGVNVWKSTDGGASWTISSHWTWPSTIGYTHADIHTLDIFGDRIYCGSDGGLHSSDDGGEEWMDRSAGLDIMQFYRLGGSELLPGTIMAGAQDNGSNRFEDGAWTHVLGADGMEAAMDVEDPAVVYASSQNGGLNRSDNGGVDWIGIAPTEDGPWVTPYVLDPTFPGRILAGYTNVWMSDTRGVTWYQATWWDEGEYVRAICTAPSDGYFIYACRNDIIARSWDGGISWDDIDAGLPNLSPTSIAVDPDDPYHVWISFSGASTLAKVYESHDAGLTWTNRSQGIPNVPVNCIVAQPESPNGLYAATDLGVFYIDDYATSWQPYGVGMPNVVVNELEINRSSGKLRAATYGRGIWETDLFISPFASVDAQLDAQAPRVLAMDQAGRFLVRPADGTRILNIRVFDTAGRTLLAEPVRDAGETQLDLTDSAIGTYLVQVTTTDGQWCRRVIR